MPFDLSSFLTAVTGRDASTGVTAMGVAQAPTDADIAEASAERAEMVGGHEADGPDLDPVYEPARPLVDEVTAARLIGAALRSTLLGVPMPSGSVALSVTVSDGVPVQVLPAAGDRPRRAVIRNTGSAAVRLSPDRRQDATGFALAASAELETFTQGPVWCYVTGSSESVSVWVDHYPAP